MTFLVVNGRRHWLSISNLFLNNIKVKGRQYPDYCVNESHISEDDFLHLPQLPKGHY